ncbi:MAG: hypothetical protein HFE78_07555 [Clostridiales bacterium]|nr:hypothetical protein [Clostridiales bacterium]
MKKYGLICLLLVLCMVWIGCSQAKPAPSEPSETEPPMVTEPVDTDPTEPDQPSDDGPGIGGGAESAILEYKYDQSKKIYALSTIFMALADPEDLSKWEELFVNEDGTTNYADKHLLSFIEQCNISKEAFVEANNNHVYPIFTDEEIDAIYSKDPKRLADYFANPHAIRVGNEIYTAKWVATHTVEEIASAGITLEELTTKYARWEKCGTLVTDIPARAQAKLAEYKEYVENKQ